VAGICPSTEANLGDGIFDMTAWRSQGGRWGVGSDSHACVNAAEELMLLEYSQRLATRQRNVLARDGEQDVATAMTLDTVLGGAQASGRAIGGLALGQQADFVVLDAQHPAAARTAHAPGHAVGPCLCQPPPLGRGRGVGGRAPAGARRAFTPWPRRHPRAFIAARSELLTSEP
jgi:formimidoylglutamate deiminase